MSWSKPCRRLKNPAVAARLRVARFHSGLTQVRFARKLRISNSAVKNYECGRVPPLTVLNVWAEVTGSTVEWLAMGKGRGYSLRTKPVSKRGRPRVS